MERLRVLTSHLALGDAEEKAEAVSPAPAAGEAAPYVAEVGGRLTVSAGLLSRQSL